MAAVARLWLLIFLSMVASAGLAKTASTVFDIAAQSTVIVLTYDGSGEVISLGSGVALPSGDIATNCHVLKGGSRFSLRYQQVDHQATRRHSDWDRDVCTLNSSTINVPAVSMGSTRTLKVGAPVFAVGAPQGLELTLSDGLVAALRAVPGGQYIQTTAPISPGSSGGGLFDEEGRLLGLITFYLSEGQNLNFALPVEWIQELPVRDVTQQTEGKGYIEWLNRAIELKEQQKYDELLEHLLSWVRAQPENSVAWHSLGLAYGNSGQTAKAVEAYQQAVRIDPEDADAWYNLGVAYGKFDQTAKAVEAYQQAIRIDPEDAAAWNNLGNAYADAGQTAKAVEAYQQAIRIDPEDADSWYDLGHAYADSGQTARAVEVYQQAIRIDPEHAAAWNNLGITYEKSGQTTKAAEAYQQAIRIDPEHAAAWNNLGITYGNSGQTTKAVEAYQQAIRIDPEDADAWYNLGNAYGESDHTAKAMEAYQQAVRIDPEYALAWYNLGVVYAKFDETSKVMDVYRHLQEIDQALAAEFFDRIVLP